MTVRNRVWLVLNSRQKRHVPILAGFVWRLCLPDSCSQLSSCVSALNMFSTLLRFSVLYFCLQPPDPICLLSLRPSSRDDDAPAGGFVFYLNLPPTVWLLPVSHDCRIVVTSCFVFVSWGPARVCVPAVSSNASRV